jgi:hypothetical protein
MAKPGGSAPAGTNGILLKPVPGAHLAKRNGTSPSAQPTAVAVVSKALTWTGTGDSMTG